MTDTEINTQKSEIDPELEYDDPEEVNFSLTKGILAEERANKIPTKLSSHCQPFRVYFDQLLAQTIFEGMKYLAKERPDDPIEYFAYFLIANNPKSLHNQMALNSS